MSYSSKNGFALITVVLLIGLLFLLIFNILTLSKTENSINSSFLASQKAYYIAEAGVQKAVWKIKNETYWEDDFEEHHDIFRSFSDENVFSDRGSLDVEIQNVDYADAIVTSTGSYDLGNGSTATRVVKARIYKTQSENPLVDIAMFAGNDIYSWGTALRVNEGGLFASDDFTNDGFTVVNVQKSTSAIDNIDIRWLSRLVSGESNQASSCSGDITPGCIGAPESLSMPNIDFNSSSPESWKNKADHIYSYQEFRDMLKNNNPLEVDGIIYVTGKVFIKKGQNLIVNGLLIAENDIKIGNDYQSSPTDAKIQVNHTAGEPSGLFSGKKITLGKWANEFRVDGVIYAEDRFDFVHLWPYSISSEINGMLLARDVNIYNLWQTMDVNYNEEIVNSTMNITGFAPVVTIEHWEEEY